MQSNMDLPTSPTTVEDETVGENNKKKNVSTQTIEMKSTKVELWDRRYYKENGIFRYPYIHYYYENHKIMSATYFICAEQISSGKKTRTEPHCIRPSFIRRRQMKQKSTNYLNNQISNWISEEKNTTTEPSKEEGQEEEEKKTLVCNKCGSKFKYRQSLNRHTQHVHARGKDEKRIHPCDTCKKKFMTISSRNLHAKRCKEKKTVKI
jgi:hypothetical protein